MPVTGRRPEPVAMPERLTEVALLKALETGLDQPPDGRRQWLSGLGLREEDATRLTRLLAAGDMVQDEINLGFGALLEPEASPQVGDIVGHFELLELIGEGGMGRVYRARRVGYDFEQEVAIKFVHATLASDELVRMFEHERRILAGLQHANVATLFDGGTFEGMPYVVMEYVQGLPIHEYVHKQGLAPTAVLELFLQVCAGVQAAHASLIVHRDLKPSNVLVTRDGVVKILDFGVAQRLQSGSDNLDQTGKLTPGYASPELLRGEGLTTSADVYSLGVLLYRLLTGVHPIGDDVLAPDALGREISAGALLPPSERSALLGHAATARLLSGDLDALIMTALDPNPNRRYATAGEFAAELRRFLTGYPLEAVPPTPSYMFRRFVGRNRIAVALTVGVVISLVGGLLAAFWQFRQADLERERAQQVNRVLQDVILSPSKWSALTRDNQLVLTRDATVTDLWQALEVYVTEQALQPETRWRILTTLAESNLNLDQWESADRLSGAVLSAADLPDGLRQKALLVRTAARHKSNHPETQTTYEALLREIESGSKLGAADHAEVLQNYGVWRWVQGDLDDAATLLEKARVILAVEGTMASRSYVAGNLGLLNCQRGFIKLCMGQLEEAISLWASDGQPPLASFHRAKAAAHLYQRELDLAVAEARTSVAAARDMYPGTLEHYRAAVGLLAALVESGSSEEAEKALAKAEQLGDGLLDPEHPERFSLRVQKANYRLLRADAAAALTLMEEADAGRDGKAPYTLLSSNVDYLWAKILIANGHTDQARSRLVRAHRFRSELLGESAPSVRLLEDLQARIDSEEGS